MADARVEVDRPIGVARVETPLPQSTTAKDQMTLPTEAGTPQISLPQPLEAPISPQPVQRGFDAFHRADDLVAEYARWTPEPAMPTTIAALDKWLRGGLRRTRIYTIAARPGEGKSSLSLSIARRMALATHVPVVYLSLEMGKQELTERLIAQSLLVDPALFEGWRTAGNLLEKLTDLHKQLQQAHLHIEDTRGGQIEELEGLFEELAESGVNPHLLVIDYLQLIQMPFGLSRSDAINTYMADLKNFAKSKHVAILLCCQINRQGNEKPSLIHLKGAGGIEESSDVVLICSRPNLDTTKVSEEVGLDCDFEIWIAKHRQGALYKINLVYRPPCFEFLEPSSYGIAKHPSLETRVIDDKTQSDGLPF